MLLFLGLAAGYAQAKQQEVHPLSKKIPCSSDREVYTKEVIYRFYALPEAYRNEVIEAFLFMYYHGNRYSGDSNPFESLFVKNNNDSNEVLAELFAYNIYIFTEICKSVGDVSFSGLLFVRDSLKNDEYGREFYSLYGGLFQNKTRSKKNERIQQNPGGKAKKSRDDEFMTRWMENLRTIAKDLGE